MAADGSKTGYSGEEDYFYRRNRELLEKRRKELDANRGDEEKSERRSAHWMKCPKCGADMEEISLSNILVDKCTECEGIFFDHGELETLLESQEQGGFLSGMRGIFKKS
ncbi:MAG: zf-TFIIB domain-containing protein [SAR324 cluster bacterium]|nr:zf-TFIIB domain-containing protein [SAR324 cluster bacterium]